MIVKCMLCATMFFSAFVTWPGFIELLVSILVLFCLQRFLQKLSTRDFCLCMGTDWDRLLRSSGWAQKILSRKMDSDTGNRTPSCRVLN